MLDCLSKWSNKEIALIGVAATIVTPFIIAYKESLWDCLKKLIGFIFKVFKNLLVKIKSPIHNWLREKIVGKEYMEVLEKLKKEEIDKQIKELDDIIKQLS